jgi:hypothetical protein
VPASSLDRVNSPNPFFIQTSAVRSASSTKLLPVEILKLPIIKALNNTEIQNVKHVIHKIKHIKVLNHQGGQN